MSEDTFERNPLGLIYIILWKKGADFQTIRINGDKLRIEQFLKFELSNDPSLKIEFHESLHKIKGGCWSIFLTVKLIPVKAQ